MEKAGEERETDTITSMDDPFKWLQELIRAMLKCLGFQISSDQPSPPASSSSSSSSSRSSYSGENGEDQKLSFQQLPIPADKDPPAPPSTTDPPPQLIAVSLSSRPTRPGLGNSGDPQTNDASS